jgi:hypothetical protein
MESGDGCDLGGAAGEGGGVIFKAVGAFERGGVAAGRNGLVVPPFHASLVPTAVGFPGVCACANWAGWELLLAELGGVSEF